MEDNGRILIFHDDNPHVLKEIKSLKTNGYEIHFKWAIINSLQRMNNKIKGKMVIPLLNYIHITYDSIESYWINSYVPNLADLIELGDSSYLPNGWIPVSRKSPKNGEALFTFATFLVY